MCLICGTTVAVQPYFRNQSSSKYKQVGWEIPLTKGLQGLFLVDSISLKFSRVTNQMASISLSLFHGLIV